MDPNFPSLDTIKEWSAILAAHQWPILVLIILFIFRDELIRLVRRIKSYKGPGGEIGFAELSEKPKGPSTPTSQKNWSNINNIFWLGHDLMWVIDVVYRFAPKNYIVHGFKQSLYHLGELPEVETAAVKDKLQKLLKEAETKPEEEWTPAQRAAFGEKIRLEIIDELSRITEKQQKSP